jgi:hypothetical protein
MERADRLKRLQELKENMNQRSVNRDASDDGVIRMIKDSRNKRVGVPNDNRRAPNSNLDIIYKNQG